MDRQAEAAAIPPRGHPPACRAGAEGGAQMSQDILSQLARRTKRAQTDEERAVIGTLLLAESVGQAKLP